MKNIIVTIGEILLGIFIFGLIFGETGSMRAEASSLFIEINTSIRNIIP